MVVVVVFFFVLTRAEQYSKDGISDAVKREITQGLQEGHGADKGIAVAGGKGACTCDFFDFETCDEINLCVRRVRSIAC